MSDFHPVEMPPTPPRRSRWRETVETVVVAFVLAIGVHAAVAEARFIPSESMVPTLVIGDRLIVEKISPHFGAPRRGEILVFYPPQHEPVEMSTGVRFVRWLGFTPEVAYIKRVVGLPGETIAVHDGQVWINDKALVEPYTNEAPSYEMPPQTVPPGHLFMMGDNRNNSQDSHVWGPLPIDNVIGHAAVRFWPITRLGVT
ncbi:MAG: signal peptidase I [Candidatus Sericytochromatia bacterium]|nr:signal peptidase I [Candidatus Sericytochromatia bacterium]